MDRLERKGSNPSNERLPIYPRGTLGWVLQRLSAAVLFGIIIVHILTTHYTTPGEPVTFKESSERLQNPLYLCLWIALLAFGLFHALYGLRAIIIDFAPIRNHQALSWAVIVIGLLIFGFGILFLTPFIFGKPIFL